MTINSARPTAAIQLPAALAEGPAPGRATRTVAITLGSALLAFGLWAGLAPLSSAALAPGRVSVEGSRQVIQHSEGGIIARILVREGSTVKAGQALMVLDDVASNAALRALQVREASLRAESARLLAEIEGRSSVTFPDDLVQRAAGNREIAEALAAQQSLFESRASLAFGRSSALAAQGLQAGAEIEALRAQLTAAEEQIRSLRTDVAAAQSMFDKGYERRPRLEALKRALSAAEGQRGQLQAQMVQARAGVGAARSDSVAFSASRRTEAGDRLAAVQAQLAEVRQQLAPAAARDARRIIAAPAAGVVMNIRYTTVGGVISPGAAVLDLVPTGARLLVDARISPMDVDVVAPGMPARVRLIAYRSRTTPTLDGKLVSIGADALTDERTGQSYYTAKVEVPQPRDPEGRPLKLTPGMPTDVMIETGKNTLIGYLLAPLSDGLAHGVRES